MTQAAVHYLGDHREELPTFEGEPVAALRVKLTSNAQLEVGQGHHRLDETARMLVIGRVTRIDHIVEERTGRLIRVETFKILDAAEVHDE